MKKFKVRTWMLLSLAGFAAACFMAAPALAEEVPLIDQIGRHATAINTIWTLLAAFLVFFMQAGFALVETGLTRAKNTCNILMKNLLDFCLGSLVFWAIGYAIMFGADKMGLFGTSGFFLSGANPSSPEGLWQYAYWLFQAVFAATAATIVSGAMAERTKFSAYLIYTVVITALIYPVAGHWIWGGGWLSKLGMVDFAGSTVVHSVGGMAALVGAIMVGPRLGKYNPDGSSNIIAGHNMPLAALGVFILWFGWFGFNPGSTTNGLNMSIATIAVTTNLAACAGALAAMFTVWKLFGKPDTSMTLNGALAGLVAITAPCASVSPLSAVIIGLVAGVLVVYSVIFIERVLKIDDPVGAVSVHMVNGMFGTLAVGLFAEKSFGSAAGLSHGNGLFFGGGWGLFLTQLTGVVSVASWTAVACVVCFSICKVTTGLRVSDEEQLKGLDIDEHGMEGYAGFQIFTTE